MPKGGFKSLTISENVYNHFEKIYKNNKDSLEFVGINSFSGFMTSMFTVFMTDDKAYNAVITRMGKKSQEIFKELKR